MDSRHKWLVMRTFYDFLFEPEQAIEPTVVLLVNCYAVILTWHRCIDMTCSIMNHTIEFSGPILGLRPANERRRYKVTTSHVGWAQTYNQPWFCLYSVAPVSSPAMSGHTLRFISN